MKFFEKFLGSQNNQLNIENCMTNRATIVARQKNIGMKRSNGLVKLTGFL